MRMVERRRIAYCLMMAVAAVESQRMGREAGWGKSEEEEEEEEEEKEGESWEVGLKKKFREAGTSIRMWR
jgi:ribosomal protein L12E/L44/L45/RPP1/RPP2